MLRFPRGTHSDRGMTLPEVMIASSVLLVCLTAMATLLATAVNSSQTAKVRDMAANLANLRIESARSLPYDNVGTHFANGVDGDPAGDILTPETVGNFVVTTQCSWIRTTTGRAAYKLMTVIVSWQKPAPGQYQVTTMIYGRSGLATSGDLDVRLRYIEDGAPVTNGTVNVVDASNSARSVSSDASGSAFFGQLAMGSLAMQVTPPAGCIVNTSTQSAVTIAADAVTTIIVNIQRPAQATINVVDTSGTPIPGASVSLQRADGVVLPAAYTDANGNAVFTSLLYSSYSVNVTKTGYGPATLPLIVSSTAPSPVVKFQMAPRGAVSLRARVFDSNGTKLGGGTVHVKLQGASTDLQVQTAGTNGEASFTGLDTVTYGVTVELAGYVTQTQTVTLTTWGETLADFRMSPVVVNGNMSITTYDKNGHLKSLQLIVSGNGYYRNTLMSSNGYLTLTDLVPGTYTVQVTPNPSSIVTTIVNGGQTSYVSVSQKK
jgi:prepilin-type N-terminal cleavage/methylation domain-containing protein